jgi:anti-sigma B factor antagonist
MWINVRISDRLVLATFTSSKVADEDMIQTAGRELLDLVELAAKSKKLLISFKGVESMSSAMIGKLVLLNKKAKTRGVQVKFCELAPNVLEVFKITRLNKVFRILNEHDEEDWRDDDDDGDSGNTGVFAKLPKHPSSGGTHAITPRDDS